jgi:hypothetical protein
VEKTEGAGLIEPTAILDAFCTGLAQIEDLGNGIRRLVFYVARARDGYTEHEIVARLVLPSACLVQISQQLIGADPAISELLHSGRKPDGGTH